ncbi:FMN-binding negative transcriptional regulator [Marinimicrococcus flavescens]|uniref:FMN-binding negative transcriptional regulator n=1 Tax=Marinimicrococcus flavescens TaxID=3031815 RepID=A0AAP3UZX3_9PROT|nr:FMN-binding negative transcriptional regulator [Marinimicrococcus flavescens]
MYVPSHFRAPDEQAAVEIVERHGFGMLVGASGARPMVTHLPMVLERTGQGLVLLGHVARANPHWQHLDGAEALAVFAGPHAHVSPDWYAAGPAVPTWNYVAAEAVVRVETVEAPEALEGILLALTRRYEPSWTFASQPEKFRQAMLRGIVGLRMAVLQLEAKLKMSQNRSSADRAGVVAGLRARGGPEDAAVAGLVAGLAPSGPG